MKVLTILGARPNFIKAFLLSHELKKRGHKEIIVHTGQHYDFEMSEVFFKELKIPKPAYNLNLKGEQINEMIFEIGNIIQEQKPDMVIVYGDTNSSLAGAMAAWHHNTKIAHVEAGERCFDMEMPEERNRIIIDHYATWLFCPTEQGKIYAKLEGKKNVWFTGNVMYDAIYHYRDSIEEKHSCNEYGLKPKEYVVMTLHRPQNVDSQENLGLILGGLRKTNKQILFSIHPRTKQKLQEYNLLKEYANSVRMINPVNYLTMLSLIKDSSFIITDSGGVQTDAYCLETPCITLLTKTGWKDTVDQGWNKVVGLDMQKLEDAICSFQTNPPSTHKNIFGEGDSHCKIINILEDVNKHPQE